ncbi:MAG: hypothetical protein ACLRFH_02100, partial [Opitutales bacterium]
NEIFAENHRIPHWHKISRDLESNLALKRFLNINMLYRPCLIKLIDPDNLSNWNYHLREQKLPFFITLAHEFLHALNQLERIDLYWFTYCTFEDFNKNFLRTLDDMISMYDFLTNKLDLQKNSIIFQKTCKELWGNNHFLDEMTVILSSERKISCEKTVFIGETTFLREYYQDDTIISWSHNSAKNIDFWQKMSAILNKNYVNKVLKNKQFGFEKSNIKQFEFDQNQEINKESLKYTIPESFEDYKQEAQSKINNNVASKISIENQITHQSQVFESLKTKQGLSLLPKYYTSITLEGYELVDLLDNTDIFSEEMIFEKFKNFLNENCGLLFKTDTENQIQYYEYKPLKKRHYFSSAKQIILDIFKNVDCQKIYYYNGVNFQKFKKLDI